MAEIVWTEPALADIDAIADYIALDNPAAAKARVQRVFEHMDQLQQHPESGSKPNELKGWRYRQIIEPRPVSFTATSRAKSSYPMSYAVSGVHAAASSFDDRDLVEQNIVSHARSRGFGYRQESRRSSLRRA